MRLHAEERSVVRGGEITEHAFQIKSTSKAFAILSSGLYTNKIRAIIRELTCNAYDAHVAAGNTDTPIEIKLPSALDPTFYVKDFGIGLDHEGVTKLYTTYFESTKADSNDYIGALGLGSKSPFSYTQTFSVEARHNGKKRFYTAFINEHGVPAIVRMSENDTDEQNGLTVSLQVRTDDVSKFFDEAQHALMYFKPQPNVIGRSGFAPYSLKHVVEGNRWKVRSADYYAHMHGAYIVQGFVAYPIDRGVMEQNQLSDLARAVLQMNIDIVVNMGDVEVAASREALSYTKPTIANIKARIEQIAQEMSTTIQQQIDACSTLWEARIKFLTLMNDKNDTVRAMLNTFRNTIGFTWKKIKLSAEALIEVDKINDTNFTVVYKTAYGKTLRQMKGYTVDNKKSFFVAKTSNHLFELAVTDKMTFVFDDLGGAADVVRQWLDSQTKCDELRVVLIRPVSKQVVEQSKKEALNIVKQLGDAPLVYASELGFEKKKVKSYYKSKKTIKGELNVWVGFPTNGGYKKNQIRRVFSRNCWNTTTIDLSQGGFYVPTDRHMIVGSKGEEVMMFDEILSNGQLLGIIPNDVTIVGMSEKEVAIAQRQGKWINTLQHIEQQFNLLNKNDRLLKPIAAHKLVDIVGRGVFEYFVTRWNTVGVNVEDGLFKTFITGLKDMCDNTYHIKTVERMFLLFHRQAELTRISTVIDQVKNEWEQVKNHYEMLSLVNMSHISSRDVDKIVNYINTVDK